MASRRSYVSPKRESRSRESRERILAAARKLFTLRGYNGTTMEAIAQEAAVSVQSLYQRFGGKAGLIRDQLDDMERLADIDSLRAALTDPTLTPRQQVAAFAAFIGRMSDAAAGLIAAAMASGDAQLQEVVVTGHARHRMAAREFVGQWRERGLLRGEPASDWAEVTLAGLTSIAMFTELRQTQGWSVEAVEGWMVDIVDRLLLVDGSSQAGGAEISQGFTNR